ncbi:MAG: hypothetical protein JXB39_00480, partial [Deltaproteobacteria bacterium]|nr:hypothetical protein [Deltaproteobacteria bacterium]
RAGWPVTLEPPPPAALVDQMAADPVPGAVLLLPAYSMQKTVSTAAFTLAAFHDRPVTALPRHPFSPAEYTPAGMTMDACAEGRECVLPSTLRRDLEVFGIRYVVLKLGPPFRTEALRTLLADSLGEPSTAGDLAWWVLLDPASPEDVAARHLGPPPVPRKGRPPPSAGGGGRQPDGGYRENLGRRRPDDQAP